jgi:hypothetical protein
MKLIYWSNEEERSLGTINVTMTRLKKKVDRPKKKTI